MLLIGLLISSIEIGMGDIENNTAALDSATTAEIISAAELTDQEMRMKQLQVAAVIEEKVYRDNSPAAKEGRRKMALRASYGEFMCTFLFLTPIFGVVANATINNWGAEATTLAAAFVSGFQAIAVSFAFSSVSGAHFNSNISFALWLTGKLSNRKAVGYIIAQFLASICGMIVIACLFSSDEQKIYKACTVTPVPGTVNIGKVFATEFFLTFILTYVAFTVAFEDAENNKKSTMSLKTMYDTKGLTVYASTPVR